MRYTLSMLTLAVGLGSGFASYAAGHDHDHHVHEGDVLPLLIDNTIVLDHLDDRPADFATGYAIFEADFDDLAGGANSTDDPGFNHEAGQFTPGTILAFKVLGPLEFWNGSQWSVNTPATLTFTDAIGNDVDVTGTSVAGGTGLIGQFDGAGNIHEHIDMGINADAATGAYAVVLSLFGLAADQTTPVYEESMPFMFVFNRGLDHEAFEAAVGARVVPVPAAAWLFGSALAGLGFARRRRAG